MRTKTGVLPLLLAGAPLAACQGPGDRTMDADMNAAALSERTAGDATPEPPDEATPPEPPTPESPPPIPPEDTPPDLGPPDMRPDPLPPGEASPEDSPPPPTSGR
ncbi:hypothetical protein [Brevundimonas sp.]|uniref:hypothetical protein n=1 Tax=Brevundimonas sp. TaxID=1871086 RepID=UPI002D6D6984|nr:hypothetical protein [Brevundimonas sp.]HYC73988.1 hypothetical protein [Brevundimonas sp.]